MHLGLVLITERINSKKRYTSTPTTLL